MHITYKGDYALKTILDLSVRYGDTPVTIHDLAKRADIPLKFLEQILLDLKRGGFVESRRGKVGGYLLTRQPSEITIGEVIRFIDGAIGPIDCLEENYHGCKDIYRCVFRPIWQEINQATSKIVDNITFEDLLKRLQLRGRAMVYQI